MPIFLALLFLSLSPVAGERQQDGCYPITSLDLRAAEAPSFERFPAQEVTNNWVPVDISSNRKAANYRTVLERGTSKGPNFAGFYSIVVWGCGSSCVAFAIVNRKTGLVIFPEQINSISGAHLQADDFLPNANTDYWGLRFRLDSRLLVLVGAINESERREGAFYYVIKNDHLKSVFARRVEKRRCHW